MNKLIFLRSIAILCFTLFLIQTEAQSFVFGPKVGGVVATQQWQNFQQNPLLAYHGDLFIETYGEDDPNVLFAQLGYHVRGSSLRGRFFNSQGLQIFSNSFRFNNLALTVGAKRKFNETERFSPFYAMGLRGEFTLFTNLDDFDTQSLFYPQNHSVNNFMYGIYAAAGVEFPFTEFVGGQLELSVNPDLSKQYFQPEIANVINPNGGNPITIRERSIRNVSIEVTLGLRLLRKVVYID